MATNNLEIFCRKYEAALWLLLIMLLAAGLRFFGLEYQSYWYDELFSAVYSHPGNTLDEVIALTVADVHPPLHQIIMWFSYKAFGYNEWAGRLPSALAGLVSIPVIYLLGKELFSRRVGLYAAALATPNFYLVYFAQEARSYALLYLLCCLSFLYFMRSLQGKHWVNVAAYIVTTVALLYTHYFGFVLILTQVVLLLIWMLLWRSLERGIVARAVIAGLSVSIAIVPMLKNLVVHAGISDFWIQQPSGWFFAQYFILYFGAAWLALGFAACIAVALIWGVISPVPAEQRKWARFAVLALLIWVVLGYGVPWLRGVFAQPVITDRNTILVVPPLLILAAYGLARVPGLLLQRLLVAALILASCQFLLVGINYYNTVTKQQYRSIVSTLIRHGYELPVYTLKFNHTKYDVYFEQLGSDQRAVDAAVLEEKLTANQAEPLFWLADGHKRRLQTDLEERFELAVAAKYRDKGVVAELLVNPQFSQLVMLEPALLSASDGNWLSNGTIVWPADAKQILVALNEASRKGPLRRVQLDILDASGHVLESHISPLGAVPSVLLVEPEQMPGDEVRLLLRMPVGEPEPAVWLIQAPADDSL